MGTGIEVGQTIGGRYHIIEQLGEGGMATVYKAYDTRLEREVAIKFIRTDMVQPAVLEQMLKRFEREAKSLAQLEHLHIVKVFDYGEYEHTPYLVMQFVQGGTLKHRIEQPGPVQDQGARLGYHEAARILAPIARALEYAHRKNVIHRDIKPSNILITADEEPMLSDFGIAKILESDQTTQLTSTGVGIGTPEYMAPEQWTGRVVPQTDIYSLGVVLYELVTGKRPYAADTPAAVLLKQANEPLPRPKDYVPDLPDEVERVIFKAMAKLPEERYESMGAMAESLERLALRAEPAASERTEVAPAAVPGRTVPGVTRKLPAAQRGAPPPPAAVEKAPRKPQQWWKWVAIAAVVAMGCLIVVVAAAATGGFNLMSLFATQLPAVPPTSIAAYTPLSKPPVSTIPAAVPSQPTVPASSFAGTIKVGVLAPLSGPVPVFGESMRNGVLIAVDEWNARGGLLGMQIIALIEDSQCTPDPAVNAANKLIDQDGVHYLIGEVCSGASLPVSEVANLKQVLQISPSSTNVRVTVNDDGSTKPFTFRACFIDSFQGQVMAKFAIGRGYKSAYVIFNKESEYSSGLAEIFSKSFVDMGGRLAGTEAYGAQDTDFTYIMKLVYDSKAEVLYVPDYYDKVNLIGAQAKGMGIPVVLMGGDGWDARELDLAAVDGGFFSNNFSPEDDRPIVQDWVKRYDGRYGAVPDAVATLAYDAANILFTAIQNAGVDHAEKVSYVMADMKYEAVTGIITFDASHNPLKNAVVLGIRDKKVSFVQTIGP